MSSKSSIFLTKDNEHIYEETSEPHVENGKFIGFTIVVEMDRKNINIVTNNDDELIIEIKPGSELYNLFKSIK